MRINGLRVRLRLNYWVRPSDYAKYSLAVAPKPDDNFCCYLAGSVPEGMPDFALPPFQFEYQNKTIGFLDICRDLGSGLFVVPLVAVSANIAIAKTFSKLPN